MRRFKSFTQSSISEVPKKPGIYVVRAANPFPRLSGATDILYIGMASRSLRHRVATFWKSSGRSAKPRFDAIVRAGLRPKFFYQVCKNPHEAERDALLSYEARHLELPPLNRAGGVKISGKGRKAILKRI